MTATDRAAQINTYFVVSFSIEKSNHSTIKHSARYIPLSMAMAIPRQTEASRYDGQDDHAVVWQRVCVYIYTLHVFSIYEVVHKHLWD